MHARIDELLDEHEPDAVALEELYFGRNVAQRVRGRPGARRRAASPPASAASRASPTRPSRSRARSAAPAARPRTRSSGWSRRCCALPEPPRPDHAADALAVAICHANHAPLSRAVLGADGACRARAGAWARSPHDRPRRAARSRCAAPTTSSLEPPAASATASPSRPRRCATCPASGARSRCTPTWSCATTRSLLYGFATEEERDLFLLLIGVQSVGPKMALAVLCGGPPRELVAALAAGDVARLQVVPGIGKRTAERIIVELREKVGVPDRRPRRSPSAAATTRARSRATACVGLGFAPAEAQALLEAADGDTRRGADRQRAEGGPRGDASARIQTPGRARRRGRARPLAAPAAAGGVRRPGRR